MGGGYANVIAIPVDPADAADGKAIVGALIKPEGTGPFPTVVYISGCAGLDLLADKALQKGADRTFDHQRVRHICRRPLHARKEANGRAKTGSPRWRVARGTFTLS